MKIKSYTMREALKPAIIKCSKNQGYKVDVFAHDAYAEKKICNYIKNELVKIGCAFVIDIRSRIFIMPDGGVIYVHNIAKNCSGKQTNLLLVDDRIKNEYLLNKIQPRITPYEYINGMMLNPKPLYLKLLD